MPDSLKQLSRRDRQQGFTLVELVLLMIMTGIITLGSTQFTARNRGNY